MFGIFVLEIKYFGEFSSNYMLHEITSFLVSKFSYKFKRTVLCPVLEYIKNT